MSTDGILEYQGTKRVLFRGDTSNIVFDTRTTSLGIGVTGSNDPSSNLYITGNAYVSSNLAIGGVMTMGVVNVAARHNLQAVTDMGNVTTHTVEFTNPTTSIVASGNVEVANDLTVSGNATISSNLTVSGQVTRTYNPGEIIEELNTVCNGRPVTVQSGTYTPTNVTVSQTSSSTHTEINGSFITYNKPAGAKRIYYKFACQWEDNGYGAITNFQIRVYHNGAWRNVNLSRYTHAAQYAGSIGAVDHHGHDWVVMEFVFECDADTESQHDGRFLSSKTSYTFDVTWRNHANAYSSILHKNHWWDGGSGVIHPPQLTIRAIA